MLEMGLDTMMDSLLKERLLGSTMVAGVAAAAMIVTLPLSALAQDADDEPTVVAEEDEAAMDDEADERMTVVGSRLRRSTATSIKPIQIISGEISRDLGLVDAGAALQDSTAASGQQIDETFTGFVLDNGPGAAQVSLRSLGADRTLVLLNGRRLAPSGVEGAPVSPDINLIPGLLTDRIELLLDGASSVYGSDAIAGVVDVRLRRDFDGLELEGFRTFTEAGGGEETTVAASWGFNTDRGFAGFGVEYSRISEIKRNQRDFAECVRDIEITEDGERRTRSKTDAFDFGMVETDCARTNLSSRYFITGVPYGVIYPVSGAGNSGIPGFSETNQFGIGVDADGDGITDINFSDYSQNVQQSYIDTQDILARTSQLVALSYGEYNIGGVNNITAFYEAMYSRRSTLIEGDTLFASVDVAATNPFNPCNPDGVRGVDCGAAYDSLLNDPEFAQQVADTFGLTPAEFRDFGIVDLFLGNIGAIPAGAFLSFDEGSDETEVEIAQLRLVGGLKGDLPQLQFGPIKNLSWEAFASYSRSDGNSRRFGVLEDNLVLSAQTTIEDPNNPGNFVCGLDVDGDGIPDPDGATQQGNNNAPECVPVDFFNPSLYVPGASGSFLTKEERDYIVGTRTFNTIYEQTIFNAFLTGDVYELPAGNVGAVVGVEYRKDELNSQPDIVAGRGLFAGFFSDAGGVGSKEIFEAFGEVEIPILANLPFAEEWTVNASARWTEEEFYGSAWTYSVSSGYRPVDWLLLRGSYGTSFRAPNLRENFLRGATGFLAFEDPCVVPPDAYDTLNQAYLPQFDDRDPIVLENCQLDGLDPTSLGTQDNPGQQPDPTTSVELSRGGSLDLEAEESRSFTAGFAFEQPWTDFFDLTVSVSYYNIEIENSIAEPNGQFVINDCYALNPNLSSAFCSRINRGSDGRINLMDLSFQNINSDNASGVDIDVVMIKEFRLFDRVFDVTLDLETAYTAQREIGIIGSDGTEQIDDNVGEFGLPEWQGRYSMFIDYDDFRFTWSTRWLGAVSQDNEFVDDFDDTSGIGDTCLPGECLARDVGFADSYFRHDLSFRYSSDTWVFRFGVNNVFDVPPPLVDTDEIQGIPGTNVPLGAGYDIIGRRYFLNVSKTF